MKIFDVFSIRQAAQALKENNIIFNKEYDKILYFPIEKQNRYAGEKEILVFHYHFLKGNREIAQYAPLVDGVEVWDKPRIWDTYFLERAKEFNFNK